MSTGAPFIPAGDKCQKVPSPGVQNNIRDGDIMATAVDATKNENPTETPVGGAKKKKKKKKVRPKLKPISGGHNSPASPGDDPYSNFLPAVARDKHDNDTTAAGASAAADSASNAGGNAVLKASAQAATTPTVPKTRIKPRISTKLKPRSSSSNLSHTSDGDYEAFGFGLVKTNENTTPKESAQQVDPDILPLSPKNQSSPLSFRRVLSSDSYISDSSSSSDESALHLQKIQRNLMADDEFENAIVEKRMSQTKQDDAAAKHHPVRVYQATCSAATEGQSSVAISASALETGADIYAKNRGHIHGVHMAQLSSQGGVGNVNSFSSSSSDGESSYFSTQGALPQSHQNQPPSLSKSQPYNPHHSLETPPNAPGTTAPRRLTPPLLMRSNSTPHSPAAEAAARNFIELKLSLSEDDDASIGRRMRASPAEGSLDSEWKRSTPPSHGSLSSADDQIIANELNAYTMASRVSQGSVESVPLSGRRPPIDGHHVHSAIATSTTSMDARTPVRSFYASPQSAMLAATAQSAAKPRAHHDSSFLSNLREEWIGGGSAASVSEGSFIVSSPGGAFGEPPEAEDRSPYDRSAKSSVTHTPQSHVQSLAYSDEDDIERRTKRGAKPSCLDCMDADGKGAATVKDHAHDVAKFKVYSSRWIMLLYVFLLNLLSGWTCYSIAPIAILTTEELDVDPDSLVIIFLLASVIGTFFEPWILGWLGLRRTILLGSLLLMAANVIKSASWMDQLEEQNVFYLGFFLAGISQPLYQCTASFIVTAWFPEWERTCVMGVALYSSQLGIGCAFASSLLVVTSDDVLMYFHLLSVTSTALFVGAAMQFEDAPPTPPSETARIIRGTVERPIFPLNNDAIQAPRTNSGPSGIGQTQPSKGRRPRPSNKQRKYWQGDAGTKVPLLPSTASFGSAEHGGTMASLNVIALAPSSRSAGPPELAMEGIDPEEATTEFDSLVQTPLPMMPGPVTGGSVDTMHTLPSYGSTDASLAGQQFASVSNAEPFPSERSDDLSAMPPSPFPDLSGDYTPREEMPTPTQPGLEYYNFSPNFRPRDHLPPAEDDGAEPIAVQTPRHLDMDIQFDQVWRCLRACFARAGFSRCALAFAASGIITSTLSTFMNYLVTLNGAEQHYVGIIGGAFQLLIIVSSTMGRRWTEKPQRLYIIIIALLALVVLVLGLCDANLDSRELLWSYLLMVAVCVAPLQPLSTELGLEVAHPLSMNTVLSVQQLFSNLLSAACIPMFKLLRDVSAFKTLRNFSSSAPDFTYSIYLLVAIQASVLLYFASFNTQYLRNREEEEGKKKKRTDLPNLPGSGAGAVSSTVRFLRPKPPLGRDQPWGKKYPFLVPSNSTV